MSDIARRLLEGRLHLARVVPAESLAAWTHALPTAAAALSVGRQALSLSTALVTAYAL